MQTFFAYQYFNSRMLFPSVLHFILVPVLPLYEILTIFPYSNNTCAHVDHVIRSYQLEILAQLPKSLKCCSWPPEHPSSFSVLRQVANLLASVQGPTKLHLAYMDLPENLSGFKLRTPLSLSCMHAPYFITMVNNRPTLRIHVCQTDMYNQSNLLYSKQ